MTHEHPRTHAHARAMDQKEGVVAATATLLALPPPRDDNEEGDENKDGDQDKDKDNCNNDGDSNVDYTANDIVALYASELCTLQRSVLLSDYDAVKDLWRSMTVNLGGMMGSQPPLRYEADSLQLMLEFLDDEDSDLVTYLKAKVPAEPDENIRSVVFQMHLPLVRACERMSPGTKMMVMNQCDVGLCDIIACIEREIVRGIRTAAGIAFVQQPCTAAGAATAPAAAAAATATTSAIRNSHRVAGSSSNNNDASPSSTVSLSPLSSPSVQEEGRGYAHPSTW